MPGRMTQLAEQIASPATDPAVATLRIATVTNIEITGKRRAQTDPPLRHGSPAIPTPRFGSEIEYGYCSKARCGLLVDDSGAGPQPRLESSTHLPEAPHLSGGSCVMGPPCREPSIPLSSQ